jgi:GTP-binding protein
MPTERWVRYVREHFPTMAYCPIAFITGQTGKNVKALLNHAQMLFKQAQERVSTSMLNKLVKAALERHEPPLHALKRPKIYYATQVSTEPPTMVLVCNNPAGFSAPYQRYLLGFLRDHLPFGEVPIKLYLQSRKRDDSRDDIQFEAKPASAHRVVQEGSVADDDSIADEDADYDDVDYEDESDEGEEIASDVRDESDKDRGKSE